MPSYEHTNLIKRIELLDSVPEGLAEYTTWIKAEGHLDLLRDNAKEDELIVYGCGDHAFIHAVVVREKNVSPLDKRDLLRWSGNPFNPCAYYGYGGENECIWIDRNYYLSGSKKLKGAQQLVFGRIFEGIEGKDGLSLEILQEYTHLTEIYWRPERNAHCRFDENGDFDPIVSIRLMEAKEDVTLVSFKREPLEQYLASSNSVLVRMFDFTLLRRVKGFELIDWPNGPEKLFDESDDLFYGQKVDPGKKAYTRGVQIIRPSRPKTEIFSSMKASWYGCQERQYVEFIIYDWRNKCIRKVSTDPAATTNYFGADENSLPFELSPAFFRPDVLLKYKADSDKYTIEGGNIYCRGGWMLRDFEINEAGQVHVYICDLREIPFQEQLHWLSHNEKPKAGISKRAIANHFMNQWVEPDPLETVLFLMRRWVRSDLKVWKIRDKALLERVSTPRTSSRDEWANAFMDLSKLIIEGFQVKSIRKELERLNITFDKNYGSIVLLERFLIGRGKIKDGQKLVGLKTVQHIRSTFAHSSGHTSHDLANNALEQHGTFSAHFNSVCGTVVAELKLIEEAFTASPPTAI